MRMTLRTLLIICLVLLVIPAVGIAGKGGKKGGQENGGDTTDNADLGSPDFSLQVIAFANCAGSDLKNTNRHQIQVLADFQEGDCETTGGSTVCTDCCIDDNDCSGSDVCVDATPHGNQASTLIRNNDIFLVDAACSGMVGQNNDVECPNDSTKFKVGDGNACDSDGGLLFLPTNVSADYIVGVRMVGQPGGKIGVTTCATDTTTGVCDTGLCTAGAVGASCSSDSDCDTVVCSVVTLVKVREVGKDATRPRFTNASKELLNICLDATCSGATKVALFDAPYEDFFWNWNTQGKPHAQLRFWHVPG